MGFLDTVKGLAKTAKCTVGLHGGDFVPIPGKPVCHFAKACPECGKRFTMYLHEFGSWDYTSPQDCWQQRTCSLCGHTERKQVHESPLTVLVDEKCNEELQCPRCKVKARSREKRHSWGPWSWDDVRQCERCGEEERKSDR